MWLILIMFSILTILFILNLFFASSSLLTNLMTIAAFASLFLKLAVERVAWLNLQFKKIQFWFNRNSDVIWSMEVRNNGEFYENTLEVVYQQMKQYCKDLTTLKSTPRIKIVRANTLVLELMLTNDSLTISAIDNQMSYYRAKKIFEDELSDLLEGIISKVGYKTVDCFIKIKFQDGNPFFGLFVKEVNNSDLINFDISFKCGSNKVFVDKESITFYSNSINNASKQVKEYLSLSYKPIKALKGGT